MRMYHYCVDRIIFLVDMNSYFATCEQMANPALRGKPIGVGGSNLARTIVAACSYEAKRYGVKNGMSVYEAKSLCPSLIMVEGNPEHYVETTMRWLKILQDYSPELEVFSIDEAFLDLTGTHERFGGFLHVAQRIKERMKVEIGELFTCSIGISYNKTLAKLASSKMKPDGLVWIKRKVSAKDKAMFAQQLGATPGRLLSTEEALLTSKLTDLCGIGPRLEKKLADMGIFSIAGLASFPKDRLQKKFGVYGAFLHEIANGEDHRPVASYWAEDPYRSMGHHYTLPEDVHGREDLEPILFKLCEKIACRLREHGYRGKTIHLLLRKSDFSSLSQQDTLPFYTCDGLQIFQTACGILDRWIFPEAVRMVGIRVSQLVKNYHQLSLLEPDWKRARLLEAMDKINKKYGDFTVCQARILKTRLKIHVGGYVEDRGTAYKNLGAVVKK
jgi:DNA polymerase-4